MNEYDKALMQGPSIDTVCCPFCGRLASNAHHIVPRSHGGNDGPTVRVCGMGNASGCHGLLHSHKLHLRWTGMEWQYIYTPEPMKYEKALQEEGWKHVKTDC